MCNLAPVGSADDEFTNPTAEGVSTCCVALIGGVDVLDAGPLPGKPVSQINWRHKLNCTSKSAAVAVEIHFHN